MSVSINSQADRMTSTISLGPVTEWTVTCWVKLASNLGRASVPWMVHDGAGGTYLRLSFYDGLQATFQTSGSTWFQLFGLTATVGTWYYIGISAQTSGMALVAHRADGSSTWGGSEEYPQDEPVTITANAITVGASYFADQYIDGSMCCLRMYQAALTREEIMNESWSNQPRRTDGLRVWYPLLTPGTADYSGHGNTLATGTATTDLGVGPALPWGPGRRRIVISSSNVSGSLAAQLPALTGSFDGTIPARGQLAGQLGALGAGFDATATVAAQLDAGLPALTGEFAGDTATPGLLNGTLPALTGSFQGELTGGFLTPTLPALTGQLTGQLHAHGELAATLPGLTGGLTGHIPIPHNNIDIAVGAPYRGWDARPAAATWQADTTAAAWAARSPATVWTADTAERGWRTLQPTT